MPTLEPVDVRNWLKRIRWEFGAFQKRKRVNNEKKIRFYLVGEYGDDSWRPHYHLAMFGFPRCEFGRTRRDQRNRPVAHRCCAWCQMVQKSWGFGDVDGGSMEEASAKYLSGYVLKKMTRNDDVRLLGRHQEFARMSLRPGIGQRAMHDIADVMLRLGLDQSEADVPSALRRGRTMAPLGRYLRDQLRKLTAMEALTKDAQITRSAYRLNELLSVYESKGLSTSHLPFKEQIIEAFRQDVLNRTQRARIFRKKGNL